MAKERTPYQMGYDFATAGIVPGNTMVMHSEFCDYRRGYAAGLDYLKAREKELDRQLKEDALAADAAWVRAQRLEWEASQ